MAANVIDGVTVRMGGVDWIIPPLTLGQMKKLRPLIQKLGSMDDGGSEETDAIVALVAAALSRNYPDLTAERVENDLLDLGNAAAALRAVLASSGLQQSGEAAPVATSEQSLTASMALSPPAADTPSP